MLSKYTVIIQTIILQWDSSALFLWVALITTPSALWPGVMVPGPISSTHHQNRLMKAEKKDGTAGSKW